jgi:hypothetical protein
MATTQTEKPKEDLATEKTAPGDGVEKGAGIDVPADGTEAELEGPRPDTKGGSTLFDAKKFDDPKLALPSVDGEGVDKIAVKFSGTVFLDRSDSRDVELMRRMKLGGDITLQVEGKCSKKGHGFSTNKEGDLDVVILEHAVSVHTVYRPVVEGDEGV